ncbi:MAG TPA: hypothetical protein PKM73_09100 [Verrucomicrobiota bacterium]|nr:hypothetical protein [Verrucomicrobiota bacterium]HNU51962.1 hypothetical protein [Verrucomicrobiota bacterium]
MKLPRWIRRLMAIALGLALAALALLLARAAYALRDRSPGYTVALDVNGQTPAAEPRPLEAGFGRVRINPDLSDPRRPVWLAGFSQNRAATSQHDDLWAAACVFDDGRSRFGIVALDAIGLFHDDVVAVRRRLPPEWKLDYTIVCSTHNHSTPDLMGLWGPNFLRSGVDPRYREQVKAACVQALGEAIAARQPVRIAFHEIPVPPAGIVTDTRKPEIYDSDLRLLHCVRVRDGTTAGTVVNWGNHPETVWGGNTEITSDFCGYLRDALAEGIRWDGRVLAEGVGGIHVFVNGAVGGLMTTSPRITVRDPYLEQDFQKPSHDKARAVGHQLVSRILPRLRDTNTAFVTYAPIGIRARTVDLPVNNPLFLLAPILGLIDRGHVRWQTLRTEVALVTLGDASFACLPGEVYPEIVNGGIERAPGGDFDLDPVEVPPIRALMPGKIQFVLGLANDEIGYIIPKSEWDRRPPYLYGAAKRVYGEINSLGPETAPRLHQAFRDLSRDNPNSLSNK